MAIIVPTAPIVHRHAEVELTGVAGAYLVRSMYAWRDGEVITYNVAEVTQAPGASAETPWNTIFSTEQEEYELAHP